MLAAGTAAGTPIRNTATATYEDPAGNPFSTESNEVTVTVAKIAGITNDPTGLSNLTDPGGTILTGHQVEFVFTVTNTGNDLSNIVIPDESTLTLLGLNTTLVAYEVDPTGTGTAYADASGGTTVPDVPIDGSILVRVVGTVTATAAGAPIAVRLGDTGSNTAANAPAADTQNQPDTADGSNANEVRTATATTPTVGGDPVNGQREASALNQAFLGSNPLALARISKTNAGVTDPNPGVGPDDLADNQITYNLELDVDTVSPDPSFIPAPLEGRDLSASITDGASVLTGFDTTNVILVSDAIPVNTTFTSLVSPAGGDWIPVYTGDTTAAEPNASGAAWNTNPAAVGTITRVGWIYDAETNGALAPGTNVTGFQIVVTTTGVTDAAFPSGTTIANIAQVYGTTDDGAAGVTGDPVFDESGDQDPSNFDGNIPGPDENDPESDGVGDPGNHGTDANNDNQGDGSTGGEDNVISVIPPGTILNGPGGQPAASGNIFNVGPDNNHDFQNLATLPAATDPTPDQGTIVDPDPLIFNNTLSNPGTGNLNGVLLQPIQPSFAGGVDTDLPAGTEVIINITINGTPTFATYRYDGSLFNIIDGSPILIPSISPGVTLNYTTTIDLPAAGDPVNADGSGSSPGTPLSTDQTGGGTGNTLVGGFPVPLIAFIDGNGDGTPNVGETSNITVDQIYTGFLRLVKQSRILQGAGPAVASGEDSFSITDKNPAPGNIIEYRVVYRNISEPQAGSGTNVVLRAQNVVITEDGTTGTGTGFNNWALDVSPADGVLDTLHVINTASDTGGGTINYTQQAAITYASGLFTSSGTIDPGNTVTGYQVTGLTIAPTGTAPFSSFNVPTDPVPAGFFQFKFQRQVSFDTSFPPAP